MIITAHNGIIFPTCTPYLDHVSDSEVLYITYILKENIFSVQKVEHIITYHCGSQPKAGTGHKMQTVNVVFSTLHC